MINAVDELKVREVTFGGDGPGITALMGKHIDFMPLSLAAARELVRSGKLKALAVGSERRFAGLPDVPAMAEVLPGFVSIAWFGVVAPPKTSPAIAEKLSAAIAEALQHAHEHGVDDEAITGWRWE